MNDDKNFPEKRALPLDGGNRELFAFEAALARLQPRVDEWDQNRLMFLAGQASVAPRGSTPLRSLGRTAWPISFGAMTSVAAVLFAMLVMRPPLLESPAGPRDSQVVKQDVVKEASPQGSSNSIATSEKFGDQLGSSGFLPVSGLSRLSAIEVRRMESLLSDRSYLASQSSEPFEQIKERPVLTTRSWEEFLPESSDRG